MMGHIYSQRFFFHSSPSLICLARSRLLGLVNPHNLMISWVCKPVEQACCHRHNFCRPRYLFLLLFGKQLMKYYHQQLVWECELIFLLGFSKNTFLKECIQSNDKSVQMTEHWNFWGSLLYTKIFKEVATWTDGFHSLLVVWIMIFIYCSVSKAWRRRKSGRFSDKLPSSNQSQ